MKIIAAPDSFKGSLNAKEAADCIERGVRRVFPGADILKVPMADGGEGTVQALADSTGGRLVKILVKDPFMRDIEASYGILGDGKTAVIEVAAASGLTLVSKDERNPLLSTTFGTGEMIIHALDMGIRNIYIGLGGSATNDGGEGMLKALGARFLDEDSHDIGLGGGSLGRLKTIDTKNIDKRIKECSFTAFCDVDNPLCGPNGASYIFGPQKGADPDMVKTLDMNLLNYAQVIKKDLGTDMMDIPGAGAAGGLGGGMIAFLSTVPQRGIDIVIKLTCLEEKIKGADLVITGEGMLDSQTARGKTPYGVAEIAKKYGIPVIAIAGGIESGAEILYEKGFDSFFSIVDKPMSLEEAITNAGILVERTVERIMRTLKIGLC